MIPFAGAQVAVVAKRSAWAGQLPMNIHIKMTIGNGRPRIKASKPHRVFPAR
jgi:hypothetical protein